MTDGPIFQYPNYFYRAKVTRVVDADTVDVDIDLGLHVTTHRRLRFTDNFDAWEVRGKEREQGLAAKRRLEELVEAAYFVFVETQMDREGKYGRVLARLWLMDKHENVKCAHFVLLEEGHGQINS